jgi:hypothetical protein
LETWNDEEDYEKFKHYILFSVFEAIQTVLPIVLEKEKDFESKYIQEDMKKQIEEIKEVSFRSDIKSVYKDTKQTIRLLCNNEVFLKYLNENIEINVNIGEYIKLLNSESNFYTYHLKFQDILLAYWKTSGVHSTEPFLYKDYNLILTDIGGASSE